MPDAAPETLRMFMAVEISEEAARRAGEIAARLQGSDPGHVKWVEPRHFHLTMKFLGATRRADVPRLGEALRDLAAGVAPFDLELTGVGAFPSLRRPQVIWLGIAAGGAGLASLASGAQDVCETLGWTREERPFHAHLTLGRLREPPRGGKPEASRDLTPLIRAMEAERDAAAGTTLVNRLVLMESQLPPRGPIYTVLDSFPLGGQGGVNKEISRG